MDILSRQLAHWCRDYLAVQPERNPYVQCLQQAELCEALHYEAQAAAVRQWFDAHPQCCWMLFPERDGQYLRDATQAVDVEQRHGAGWFERVTGRTQVGVPQDRREVQQVQQHWYGSIEDDDLDEPLISLGQMSLRQKSLQSLRRKHAARMRQAEQRRQELRQLRALTV